MVIGASVLSDDTVWVLEQLAKKQRSKGMEKIRIDVMRKNLDLNEPITF